MNIKSTLEGLAYSQVESNPELATCLYAICGSMYTDSLSELAAYLTIFAHYKSNVISRALEEQKEGVEISKLFGGRQ